MKTIYISGKITGLSTEEYEKSFAFAEENSDRDIFNQQCKSKLIKAKTNDVEYHPINPVAIGNELQEELIKEGKEASEITWREYMIADIIELVKCDAIYMIKGWELSRGARLEHHIASDMGMEVFYQQITR